MSANYDRQLWGAKAHAIQVLCQLHNSKQFPDAATHMATAIDDLNKAWDELTDCLIRQRDERDMKILALIDELAESRKGK